MDNKLTAEELEALAGVDSTTAARVRAMQERAEQLEEADAARRFAEQQLPQTQLALTRTEPHSRFGREADTLPKEQSTSHTQMPSASSSVTIGRDDLEQLLRTVLTVGQRSRSRSPTRLFSASRPAADSTTLGRRAAVAVKSPEPYKLGADIDAWLARAKTYAQAAGLDQPADRAVALASGLSQDAYTALYRSDLPSSTWQDPDDLEDAMRRCFDDQKTEAAWGEEYRSAKQDAKEGAGQFVDRVKYLARRAYSKVFATHNLEAQLQLVRAQVITGLRSKEVKRGLLRGNFADIPELRDLAVQLEKDEIMIGTQPATSQAASHFSSEKPGSSKHNSVDADSSAAQHQTKKAKGQKWHKGQKKTNSSADQDGSGSTVKCQLCGKVGHIATKCYSLKTAQKTKCKRCGRLGHEDSACFREKHVDGSNLKPNGVVVPEWFTAKTTSTESATKPKNSDKAESHLNVKGDVSAQARPRTKTTW
jgi:hypothetical protein